MAQRGGMYSSNKRRKELKRQKKQEEKTQKRLKKDENPSEGSVETESLNPEAEAPETTDQETVQEPID
jgi:hypothetical protein